MPVVVPMRKGAARHRAGPDLRELVPTEPGGVKPVVDIKAGATIGGYTLPVRIGAGGMGTVWLSSSPCGSDSSRAANRVAAAAMAIAKPVS